MPIDPDSLDNSAVDNLVLLHTQPANEALPKGVLADTELANAHRLALEAGRDLRFVRGRDWFIFRGSHWRLDDESQAERRAHDVARNLEIRAADTSALATRARNTKERERLEQEAERLRAWAKRSQSAKAIKATLEIARTLADFVVQADELDRDPMLLGCANGTVDLRTGELKEAARSDLITKASPAAYDKSAQCPAWDAFLKRIFVTDELIEYVRRACGYSLTASTAEQCLFVLYGEGANGKSTFLEALRYIVGAYGQTTPTATLMQSQKAEHRNDVARLQGARFVTASETAEGKSFDEELIKRLTGGDKMTARFLRQEFFEFTPVAKFWMATNHKPEVRGVDNGIWRRLKLVPFAVTIPVEERDPCLGEKLRAEAPGILAWAVRGCLEWQAKGLQAPEAIASATHEWRQEANHVVQFVDERCARHEQARAKSGDLYSAYRTWAKESGTEPLNQKAFGQRLSAIGFCADRGSKGVRLWSGLAVEASSDSRGGDG